MPGIATREAAAFANYSRIDIISSESALRSMNDRMDAWIKSGNHPMHLYEDLLTSAQLPGGWQWQRFLMGRPWGEQLFREDVTSLVLVVRDGMPCLMVRTRACPTMRAITWQGSKCRINWE